MTPTDAPDPSATLPGAVISSAPLETHPSSAEPANSLRALRAGLRIALLQRPRLEGLRFTAGMFWFAAAISIALSFLLSYLVAETPRRFEAAAFETQGFGLALTLYVCFLLARAFRADILWPLAVLTLWASLVTDSLENLLELPALVRLQSRYPYGEYLPFSVFVLWWIAIFLRSLSSLVPQAPRWRRLRMSVYAVALLTLPAFYLHSNEFWTRDYYADYLRNKEAELPPINVEELFGRQDMMVERALAELKSSTPGKPQLYFLGFSPDGDQDVFHKEALYARRLFETRFGAAGRSLLLINNRQTLDEVPLATATNLEHALRGIAQRMTLSDDILFLFVTSHGSRDANVAVELDHLKLRGVSADVLANALKASGIRWKVIVVSACYSGSFLPALTDDHTLVITAARADRTSFGCSNDADFTWFGRAYFEQALNHTRSFVAAFGEAKTLIGQWETRDHYDHSEPRIARQPPIEQKLAQWTAHLPAETPVH